MHNPKHFFLTLPLFFLLVQLSSANSITQSLNIWEGIAKPKEHKKVKKSYGIRVTEVTNATLEVIEPTKPNGIGIILAPGGAYKQLAIDKEGYEIAEYFKNQGYTIFVLNYSVPNKRKKALQDIQRAIRLVKYNAKKWSLDKNSIGFLGFSAGGHLSAMATLQADSASYSPADHIDQESLKPAFAALIYPAYLDQEFAKKGKKNITINQTTAPLFISVSADDQYVKSSLALSSKLIENKINHHFHLFPSGGHGYGLRATEGGHAAEAWPVLCNDWLKTLFLKSKKH